MESREDGAGDEVREAPGGEAEAPDLEAAKASAKQAAAERGHKLGAYRWEMPMGGTRRYLIAQCDKCGCGMTVRPDSTFGGSAIKQDCGAARAAAAPREKRKRSKAQAAAPPSPASEGRDAAAPKAQKESEAGMKSKAKTKAKPETPKRAKSVRAGTQRAKRNVLFDLPAMRVLRWMGQHGFNIEQATAALKAHGIVLSRGAVSNGLSEGRMVKAGKRTDEVAKLGKDQQDKLLRHKK